METLTAVLLELYVICLEAVGAPSCEQECLQACTQVLPDGLPSKRSVASLAYCVLLYNVKEVSTPMVGSKETWF